MKAIVCGIAHMVKVLNYFSQRESTAINQRGIIAPEISPRLSGSQDAQSSGIRNICKPGGSQDFGSLGTSHP